MEPDYWGGQAPPVGLLGGPVAPPAPLVPTPLHLWLPVAVIFWKWEGELHKDILPLMIELRLGLHHADYGAESW